MENRNTTNAKLSERSIEAYFGKTVREAGALPIKLAPTYEAGIPDRMVVLNGCVGFAELKATGKKPRQLQVQYLAKLTANGVFARVVDSKEGAHEWLRRFKEFNKLA